MSTFTNVNSREVRANWQKFSVQLFYSACIKGSVKNSRITFID